MKRFFWFGLILVLGFTSFKLASDIEVYSDKYGITILRKGVYEMGIQDHHIFVPGNGENLQKIFKKALDWQELNKTKRQEFTKLIDELNVYHSKNHFRIIQSTEYNHKAAFRFQGKADGSCKLLIEETKGRTKRYQTFYTIEGNELAAFAKLFEFKKNCKTDGIFE